jgi:hypothetical protein
MIQLLDLLKEDIIEKATSIPTILESLPIIKSLGDKTLLTREFKGIRMGAAKITAGPIEKGRIGNVLNPQSPAYQSDIADLFQSLIDKFGLNHIIYCSHGDVRFLLGGDQYCMVPIGEYKTVWSPQIKDIYADASRYKKENKLNQFPIDSYQDSWPTGNVNEVLVDCSEYYLITTKIPIVQKYMKVNGIEKPKTYNELYNILEGSVEPYKNEVY